MNQIDKSNALKSSFHIFLPLFPPCFGLSLKQGAIDLELPLYLKLEHILEHIFRAVINNKAKFYEDCLRQLKWLILTSLSFRVILVRLFSIFLIFDSFTSVLRNHLSVGCFMQLPFLLKQIFFFLRYTIAGQRDLQNSQEIYVLRNLFPKAYKL